MYFLITFIYLFNNVLQATISCILITSLMRTGSTGWIMKRINIMEFTGLNLMEQIDIMLSMLVYFTHTLHYIMNILFEIMNILVEIMNVFFKIMNILFKFINIVRNIESFVTNFELFMSNYKQNDKDIQTIFWGIPNIIFIISYEMFIV